MSYRCQICGIKVPPKHPRLTWQDKRGGQITKELSVCEVCLALLRTQGLTSVKDPYYLRPKHTETAVVEVPIQTPEKAPLSPEEIGRPAKIVTL